MWHWRVEIRIGRPNDGDGGQNRGFIFVEFRSEALRTERGGGVNKHARLLCTEQHIPKYIYGVCRAAVSQKHKAKTPRTSNKLKPTFSATNLPRIYGKWCIYSIYPHITLNYVLIIKLNVRQKCCNLAYSVSRFRLDGMFTKN